MFYLKDRGKKLEILDDNVFTICPRCGREHAVDLQEVLGCGFTDLYGTAVYCPACNAEKLREKGFQHPLIIFINTAQINSRTVSAHLTRCTGPSGTKCGLWGWRPQTHANLGFSN